MACIAISTILPQWGYLASSDGSTVHKSEQQYWSRVDGCWNDYIQHLFLLLLAGTFLKKSEISAMRKNQRPYTYVGLVGLKMGISLGLAVCYTHTMLSHLILSVFLFHSFQPGGKAFQSSCAVYTLPVSSC